MAESAVSFVVERIGDTLLQKAIFLKGVQEQVELMQSELKRMQCFLKDADAREQEDEMVRNWVSEIRDLAYDAEDAIDVFIFNVESGRRKFFTWRMFKKLPSSYKVGNKIEAIQNRIQNISRSRETYGIKSTGAEPSRAGQKLRKLRYTSPLVKEEVIVGLKEETDELVEKLVRGDLRRRVVSIVGMGGIGKTTLAKKVYNHSRVMDHFSSCRAWVYVSQDCRPRDVFQQILNQLPYNPTEDEARKIGKLQEEELGYFLHKYLKEKRFLVVLDDIWENDDWKCLGKAFPEESNGSRLLLTTRIKAIALQADARSVPHDMKLLSEEQSWKLFCRTAIPDNVADSCPPDLKEIGEKMVRKCASLPLAIVVLGGLLASKSLLPTVWEEVFNKFRMHLAASNGVDAILSLSYIDLPHNLKSCFLYLGLFPEDGVIHKRTLLLLWIAEGFVTQQDGQRMEDTAEDYLNELINRNLVQAVTLSVNERVAKCRIHDLVRDLCIKKAKEQNFLEIHNDIVSLPSTESSLPSKKARRLGIYLDLKSFASIKHSTPYIRSLLFFQLDDSFSRGFIYKYFKLLRVLDLGNVGIKGPTNSLGKLIHLRYLKLGTVDRASLGRLKGLQTLDVKFFAVVPTMIQKMENLRHLFLSYNSKGDMPLRIDTLKNLQTLSGIRLRDWQRNNTSKLTNLRKLKIKVDDASTALSSNSIADLHNLRSLYIEASYGFKIPFCVMNSWLHLSKLLMKGSIEQLPKAHEFPPSLTQLTLEDIELSDDHMMILERLPKLLTFRLRNFIYDGGEMQVSTDGFPQLKILQISDSRQFPMSLNINKGCMPKLTHLQIFRSYFPVYGVRGLLHLRKIDVDDAYFDVWIPSLQRSSEWHEIRSKPEKGRTIRHFYR